MIISSLFFLLLHLLLLFVFLRYHGALLFCDTHPHIPHFTNLIAFSLFIPIYSAFSLLFLTNSVVVTVY
jgi:hypothetical protein